MRFIKNEEIIMSANKLVVYIFALCIAKYNSLITCIFYSNIPKHFTKWKWSRVEKMQYFFTREKARRKFSFIVYFKLFPIIKIFSLLLLMMTPMMMWWCWWYWWYWWCIRYWTWCSRKIQVHSMHSRKSIQLHLISTMCLCYT